MTYGVDQCRVCGASIGVRKPEDLENYQKALRKPTMPEAEWRKLGFLAVPTRYQLQEPGMGCCAECGIKQVRKKSGPLKRFGKIAFLIVAAFVAMWFIILTVPQ